MDIFCVILVGDELFLVYFIGVVGVLECFFLFFLGGDSFFYNNVFLFGVFII